jgi:hypothetical protein
LIASNSAWVIAPSSRSFLALSISAAAPPPSATERTYSSICAFCACACSTFRRVIDSLLAIR